MTFQNTFSELKTSKCNFEKDYLFDLNVFLKNLNLGSPRIFIWQKFEMKSFFLLKLMLHDFEITFTKLSLTQKFIPAAGLKFAKRQEFVQAAFFPSFDSKWRKQKVHRVPEHLSAFIWPSPLAPHHQLCECSTDVLDNFFSHEESIAKFFGNTSSFISQPQRMASGDNREQNLENTEISTENKNCCSMQIVCLLKKSEEKISFFLFFFNFC